MILSASRRTDIPAFYPDWLVNRLREGFAFVRNPMNYHQVSKVILSPENIDCIVFWTKNPKPLIKLLDEIDDMGYRYYFQFTLTPYGSNIERCLPRKETIAETFRELSERCGAEKVIWRYDPVFISEQYSLDYHLENFARLAENLSGYTRRCVFSFLDPYAKIKKATSEDGLRPPSEHEMQAIAQSFSEVAKPYGIQLETCAEAINFERFDIKHSCCIDRNLIESIIGYPIQVKKDSSQRPACGCAASIDIGAFDTCVHGCTYCYANRQFKRARENHRAYDPTSALLCSEVDTVKDVIKPRKERDTRSLKVAQQSLF